MSWKRVLAGTVVILALAVSFSIVYSTFRGDGDYRIETRSPKGTYTVVFEGKTTRTPSLAGSSERVKLIVLKGQHTYFVKDPFFGENGLDPHFRGVYPTREWLNDQAIRLGHDNQSQPFADRITVVNKTTDKLAVLEIFYGKYERFLIFDFEPQAELVLSPSPQFGFDAPPAASAIYRAVSLNHTKERQGMVEQKERNDPADGALDFTVTINEQ